MSARRPRQSSVRTQIAERRKRINLPADQSGVLPGPWRVLDQWASNGRILSIPLFLLALAGFAYIIFSPRFQVRDIRVEGNQLLHPADVIGLSGVKGQSIWLVDQNRVAIAIRSNAYVEQVHVELTLPDRITIAIQERKPEVRWQSAGKLLEVTADGRVLGSDTTVTLTDTLVIEDRSGRVLQPNDLVDQDALALGRELSLRLPHEVGIQPTKYIWAADTGILVNLGNRTIIFGQRGDLDRKLAILAKLVQDRTVYTYLDLRPDTPYYRNDIPAATPTTTP